MTVTKGHLKCFDTNVINLYATYGSYDTFSGKNQCYESNSNRADGMVYNRDPMLTMK